MKCFKLSENCPHRVNGYNDCRVGYCQKTLDDISESLKTLCNIVKVGRAVDDVKGANKTIGGIPDHAYLDAARKTKR